MKSRTDRARQGPSVAEVFIGATLSVLIGVLLAAFVLVTTEVESVREMPEELEPGVVYYLPGSKLPPRDAQFPFKRQAFLSGNSGEIRVVEEELNAWSGGIFQAARGGEGEGGWIRAEAPNFRVSDGVLQIGATCDLDIFGFKQQAVVQVRGTFVDGARFEPSEIYFGSCPLHKLPLVDGILLGALRKSLSIPEEVVEAWERVNEATIDGNTVVLTL